mgnify:CR=1 FL=1
MKKPAFVVTALVGVYVALQLIADVTAVKIVEVAGVTLPAATFIFAITFTWRDMIHKRLGREWARAAIWTAAIANVGMALYFVFVINLPSAVFWGNQEALAAILGVVPRITIASILAELVSELLDTEVYHWLVERIPTRHQWARVLGSNAISLPVDSIIFVGFAFGGTMPVAALVSVAVGQIVFKGLVTLVSLPLIYAVPERPILAVGGD